MCTGHVRIDLCTKFHIALIKVVKLINTKYSNQSVAVHEPKNTHFFQTEALEPQLSTRKNTDC
jgi:hypothetical protein